MLIIIFNLFQNLDGSLLQVLSEVIAADLNGQSQKTDSQKNDNDGKYIDTETTDKKPAERDMSNENSVKVHIMPKFFRGGGFFNFLI